MLPGVTIAKAFSEPAFQSSLLSSATRLATGVAEASGANEAETLSHVHLREP